MTDVTQRGCLHEDAVYGLLALGGFRMHHHTPVPVGTARGMQTQYNKVIHDTHIVV